MVGLWTRDRAVGPRTAQTDGRWLRSWVIVVTLGETVGFLLPAIVGVTAYESQWFVPLLVAAGVVEGLVMGWAQASILRRRISRLRSGAWIALTAGGAAFAYSVGMVPSTTADTWTQWPPAAQAILLAALGVLLLASIGSAQWLELRRHLQGAGWWIVSTAAAWAVALGLFLVIATPLWHEGQAVWLAVAIGAIAGLVMAAAMATITGVALVLLLRRPAEHRTRE